MIQHRYNRFVLAACFAAVLTIFYSVPAADAQAEQDAATEVPTSGVSTRDLATLETLNTLIFNRKELMEEIKVLKHERDLARNEEDRVAINAELERLRGKLADVESDFESIATGVDLDSFLSKPKEKIDWKEELLNLVTPLLSELKQITDRPRQLEKLRREIQFLKDQLETVRSAMRSIDALIQTKAEGDVRLQKALEALRENWQEREKQISDKLRVDQYQLDELLRQRQSLFESSQEVVKSFFRSRGKNAALAVIAFFATFFLMRYLHRLVYRYSPIHKGGGRSFFIRATDVAYHLFTAIGSTSALLFVLYAAGDWLLLSLAIIFILGIAWAAKEGLPIFWRQVQLMLNLGTVRENERITYKGVPWRVVTLNLYAVLENPAFRPSRLRVPLRDLLDLNSRAFDEAEPWFPCHIGEWVILPDGHWGEILSQTPEMVELGLKGGSRITYPTPDFLSMNPKNISRNFRVKIIFGLDYNLQAEITEAIPKKLQEILREKLEETGYFADLRGLKVEVQSAGASSLDLAILADFEGRAAVYHNVLTRLINRLLIEACNENGWNIPFPQLTVHTQEPLALDAGSTLS